MSSRLTSKGQVTIPKKVRDFLGISPGSAIEFETTPDGRVVILSGRRKASKPSPFARLRGTATVKMTTRQIMALTRGED